MAAKVLVIDSDDLQREQLRKILAEQGFEVTDSNTAIGGLLATLENDPNLILIAEEVRPLVAGDLLPVLRLITSSPIIVIGSGDDPEEAAALESGADFYQRRPFSPRVLTSRIRSLLRRHGQASRIVRPIAQLEMIDVTSAARSGARSFWQDFEHAGVAGRFLEGSGSVAKCTDGAVAPWPLRQGPGRGEPQLQYSFRVRCWLLKTECVVEEAVG